MSDFESRMQLTFPAPSKIFTPVVTAILILLVAGLAVSRYAPNFTINNLAISSQGIFQGKIWQLVTYSLITTPCNFIFHAIMLIFVGSIVERQWRSRSFLSLWLIVSVTCGLVWVLVTLVFGRNIAGYGTASCSYGIIAAFGILYRGKKIYFLFTTIEAQYLAMIFIGIGLVLSIVQLLNLIWVSGALVAYLYIKLKVKFKESRISNNSGISRGSGNFVDID